MYERNAIVLERYFDKIFDFKNSSNLRENYLNYRKLFECYGTLCDAREKEEFSQNEFSIASKEISKLQKNQEKLYNKGAKFEYSRYVIFNNIKETPEDIEKHLNKVEEDVQKNSDDLKALGEKFVQAVIDYNEKEERLKEAKVQREKAQKEYNDVYQKAQKCYGEISEEMLQNAKAFIASDNKENRKELQDIFENNGKNEKNQFDPDVISNTINKSIEINKIEVDTYLAGYDRISKLLEEIETDAVKNDKHTKYYKDSKAKLDFVAAEKEYLIQFLDNERIGAIYDKKVHRKLMLEACKKFVLDFEQIDKLYEIIIKETIGRSTKKIYKENYHKEYLVELESASIEPSLDTGRMRQEAIAFMNLNYWRVEGIRRVYEAFEEVVTTINEKDLSEFIPEELKAREENVENIVPPEEISEESVQEEPEIFVEPVKEAKVEPKAKPRKVYYSSKIKLANAIYHSLQTHEFGKSQKQQEQVESVEVAQEIEQFSIPENVKEILANVEEEEKNSNFDKLENREEVQEDSEIQHGEYFDLDEKLTSVGLEDEIEDEEETEEDSILEEYLDENETQIEEPAKATVSHLKEKKGIFQRLVGFNAKRKKEA